MTCEQTKSQLSAWLDGELDPAESAAVESHVATCASCRNAAESLRGLDANLRCAFGPHREAAAGVAMRVVAVESDSPRPIAVRRAYRPNWLSILLATAVGFLTALIVFPPWKSQRPAGPEPRGGSNVDPRVVPVAHVTAVTGNVDFRKPGNGPWQPITDLPGLACASDGEVRTTGDVLCELKTTDDCVVRLNGETEIVLRSGRQIELKRGEIWCRSPENVVLEVIRPETGAQPETPSPWSCTRSATEPDGVVQATSASGAVSVKTSDATLPLQPGETAWIEQGQVQISRPQDPLLATSWMQPLLTRKGHADPELEERVDKLLAQIGRSKAALLYESEIRRLGEFGVLPLLRYVESPGSTNEPAQRLTAMQIASDLAPAWAIGDMVQLLDDDDPEVRFLAATALQRLTGLTQDCPPEMWRERSPATEQAQGEWRQWWASNRTSLPEAAADNK